MVENSQEEGAFEKWRQEHGGKVVDVEQLLRDAVNGMEDNETLAAGFLKFLESTPGVSEETLKYRRHRVRAYKMLRRKAENLLAEYLDELGFGHIRRNYM